MDIFNLVLFLIFILAVSSFISLAPWVPTKSSDFKRVHKFAKLKKGQRFLEVGCGIAGVSLFMAKNNPDAEIVGVELSPVFYAISKLRAKLSGLENITIQFGNALKQDFGKYDVIYIFGLPETVTKNIYPKLQKEMKQGNKILSYCFNIEDETVKVIQHKEQKTVYSIYEYIK